MPHQCVKCGKIYPDGSNELLKGCTSCTSRFFFFIKEKDLEESKKITEKLTNEEKQQIEQDVLEIIGIEDDTKPVILDLESIRILQPGKYELDIVELFKGKPLVYRVEEGKYIIDLASTFGSNKKSASN
ncbi:MAG: Zn-ribbon containing protein [Candidatus Nanoarchaeia archaeon]|jgi:hypothetical protein|nr:Zn-ribbon containing protein [Candidatus Nanoarchaeia archaeon]|tara:strand:+ start:47282 stop:47668 length:387 start_codon:yes stop_codon:yes gene_type:complete